MKPKNVTISLDENLLKAGRRYAKLKGTSINDLFREFLKTKVVGEPSNSLADELMDAFDNAEGSSGNRRWKREDAYSR